MNSPNSNSNTVTAQLVFDQVVTHLLVTQRARAVMPGGTCAYRGRDANDKVTMCAAGCLIRDDEYTPQMEGTDIRYILLQSPTFLEGSRIPYVPSLIERLGPHKDLIRECQSIHDGYLPERWEGYLRTLARRFKLEFNLPSEGYVPITSE